MANANTLKKHKVLTAERIEAYAEILDPEPATIYSAKDLVKDSNAEILIDIFVYRLETPTQELDVAITNGMSDRRLPESDDEEWVRRELIQYFPKCTPAHALRLYHMAWLPHFDKFYLDTGHTIAWPD